jgi:PAS domain S-box-containing protein
MAKSRKRGERIRERHVDEQAATQAQLRLAAIVESTDDAIIGKDMNGIITDWNDGAARLYGYPTGELVGKPISLLLPPDRADDFLAIMTKIRGGEVVKHFDTVRQRKDGTRIEVSLTVSPIVDPDGRIVGASTIARDISERKQTEEALATMSRKLLEAQEQERKRIARELHDNTNQRLALLAVGIEELKNAIPDQIADVRIRVDEIYNQTLEISEDVQALSHELHSSRLEYLGLVLAVQGFCKDFGDRYKVEVAFASEGMPATVLPEISFCLFRVMQEGLHNALKHSGVTLFEVKLLGSPAEIRLTIRDSGVGFEPELAKDTPGLGLIGMQERVRLVKGAISITSKPQSGTEISVSVPVSTGERTERAKLAGA